MLTAQYVMATLYSVFTEILNNKQYLLCSALYRDPLHSKPHAVEPAGHASCPKERTIYQ